MKALLHKIGAVGLVVLFLFTTFSFTVDLHYCGKHLVDFAINDEATGCAMDLPAIAEARIDGQSAEMCKPPAMPCCQDVELVFEGNEDLQTSVCASAPQPLFVPVPITTVSGEAPCDFSRTSIPHRDYFPPPLIRDISVLHQVFLI